MSFYPSAAGFGPSVSWNIASLVLIQGGYGYTSAPAVSFSPSSAATAVTTISSLSGGGGGSANKPPNPAAVGFYQERLTIGGAYASLQTFNMSQPGSFFNYDFSNPTQDGDAISGTIVSEDLNDIRSFVSTPTGIIALTGKTAWLINGGGGNGLATTTPITPANETANPQAFNGASFLRPIKINLDMLYTTNKGNYVRDLAYNIYANIYTGSDISVLSNHLFFNHNIVDWAWAEEPFKTVWCVRDDGILLSLGYVKEQDLIGWAHHDTDGQFLSVCSVIETVNGSNVDAVYVIVQRQINGQTVQYVERFDDRQLIHGYFDSWCVDCGLQTTPAYSATNPLVITGDATEIGNVVTLTDSIDAPFTLGSVTCQVDTPDGAIYTITAYTSTTQVTAVVVRPPNIYNLYNNTPFPQSTWYLWVPSATVGGLTQLVGQSVVGVADGVAVGPLTVAAGGVVTLSQPASKVTLGLQYTPQLQTLPLDLGEPTTQGKRKKIVGVTVRVADTLGLQIGKTFGSLVTMKDFQIGAIPTTSSGVVAVTDLVNPTGDWNDQQNPVDGRTIIDQDWESAGNYCIEQNLPYPATILGVIPEVAVGDTR